MLLCAVAATACEKNAVQDITGTLPGSRIKFFNYGVNAPPVNFYANDTKVTAVTSATGIESVNGVAYGGQGSGGFYSALVPGQYTVTGRIAATVDKDLPVARVAATLVDGKAYSVYLSGFYDATAKTVDGFVLEDLFDLTAIDYTQVYIRFVNASSNSQPMTLFARNNTTLTETPIGAATAYKGGSALVALPNGVYELNTRLAGSGVNTITRTGINLVAGRVYTINAFGDMTIVSTTAATRPQLIFAINR